MNIGIEIMHYAQRQSHSFRRKDILAHLKSVIPTVSYGVFAMSMNRLLSSGKLVRIARGEFTLGEQLKPKYSYSPTQEEYSLVKQIKQKFPFTAFCVWRASALTPFMQHVPAVDTIFIDVERVAMESLFSFLQELGLGCQILLNPSRTECDRYLTTEKAAVVRLLTSEAPTEMSGGVCVPTLEKMLVDATGDKELNFAQGAEIYRIFENAFERNDLNRSRLMRYAKRRNRNKIIEEILNSLEMK